MPKQKPKYCSLDIETSGFDPQTCEVLEVGFAFFELDETGIKITEEFTQVFKPAKEVAPTIFGLTGITREELDAAPRFEDFKPILQEKLGDAVIVGHNVVFDMNFLENFGITFCGQVVDTLDLVQFILPTHHSYNLENLMHVFRVSHKEAHRALADAKATLIVLEKMLRLYNGYPMALKKQISSLIGPLCLPWTELLAIKMSPVVFSPPAKFKPAIKDGYGIDFKAGRIYDFNLEDNYLRQTIAALKQRSGKSLLVLPKDSTVLELWKEGLVDAVFGPEMMFSEQKFEAFLQKAGKTPEEVKFLLKILVWKHTNWQNQCLLDLNLSFFGGQFKAQVSGGEITEQARPKLLCCSQATLCGVLADKGWYKNRLVIIEGLAELEQYLSSGLTTKVSWGYIAYLLKSVYNPELKTGNKKMEPEVAKMLERTDLFFGLAGAFFQNDPASFQYVKVNQDLAHTEKFQKLAKAAENYAGELEKFAALASSKDLKQAAKELTEFFELAPEKVHWLELGDKRCAFFSALLNIAPLVKKTLENFSKISFIDSLGNGKILSYFTGRLGLQAYERSTIQWKKTEGPLNVSGQPTQGDLFYSSPTAETAATAGTAAVLVKKPRLSVTPAPIYHCLAKPLTDQDLTGLLLNASLPAAVLLGTATQVKGFYDENYQELQAKAHLLANTHSGGSTKLFHNFFIDPNSILLVTDKFILKYLNQTTALEPVRRLPVKTLIVGHLPFEQFSHPYQEALTSQFANSFLDYSLPKAIYNLHRLLRFFSTPELENVYIWDAKLAKGYGQDFMDYLQGLSGTEGVRN